MSNLAGAVYAGTVNVDEAVTALTLVPFAAEVLAEEEEPETEETTEEATEEETETEAVTEEEPETEAVTEEEPETEAETEEESETEAETEEEPETEAETEEEPETEEMTEEEPLMEEEAAEAETEEDEAGVMTADETEAELAVADETGDKTIAVSAQALYGTQVLTATKDVTYYVALYTMDTDDTLTLASEVQKLTLPTDAVQTAEVSFEELLAGTYYVVATDRKGEMLSDESVSAENVEVVLVEEDESTSVVLSYVYGESWPKNTFSYSVDLSLTVNVVDRDGADLAESETFYLNIYSNAKKTTLVNEEPIAFAMDGESTKTQTYALTLTQPSDTYYFSEVAADGSALTTGENFGYVMTWTDADSVTITCGGEEPAVLVQNKVNDSVVNISVSDGSSLLAGAKLAVKDSTGAIYEVSAIGSKTWTSGTKTTTLTNALTDGETYSITEITAPSGYTPISDVSFTVQRGLTTEVVLVNEKTVSTGYSLTVSKEVYCGDCQLYAYDTTSGSYAAAGAYTYYVALFADSARTKKVSDVVSITVSAFTGSTTFSNLTAGGTYYVAETDEYGIVQSSGSSLTIKYTNSGKVTLSSTSSTMVVQNVYSSLPDGYRYTGILSLTLNVTDSTGTAEAVSKTFYLGIYRSSDYSDTPTIVSMTLSNASTVTVRRRILLSGESDMTYYIAEVDSSGNRITDDSDFSYNVSIDNPTATITKGGTTSVTVTNKAVVTKVTLYITKRVYEGSTLTGVSDTFYAGLFKDSDLTTLYTSPIALSMNGKSELTLKLTLNLGSAKGAMIYVAEVDKNGNVITDEASFGYEIKIVNSTAAFTQDKTEIQSVIINSVYGTSSDDDWSNIADEASELTGDDASSTIDSNGSITTYSSDDDSDYDSDDDSVETGDATPIAGMAALLLLALAVFGWEFKKRYTDR